MNNQLNQILKRLSVLNYDNGIKFTVRDRLDAISGLLEDTKYKKVDCNGLFEMYAINGILPENPIVVSTHIDCSSSITKCFYEEYSDEYLRGTFDNMITNAMMVSLMSEHKLSENVVVAFTGDEEVDSRGAIDVIRFVKTNRGAFRAVILDVTDMGWDKGAMFSVENNFWSYSLGKEIIGICKNSGSMWVFVPSDADDIPHYIPENNVINEEALCDESWEYDESDIECFSLCIPTCGEMHNNSGLLVRKESVEAYRNILVDILDAIA